MAKSQRRRGTQGVFLAIALLICAATYMLPVQAYANTAEGNTAIVAATVQDEEPASVDDAALQAAIKAAQDSQTGVRTSDEGGTDVGPNFNYVTPSERQAFDNAIADAQAVVENANATQDEVDAALDALTAAQETYLAARKPGSKVLPAIVSIEVDRLAKRQPASGGVYEWHIKFSAGANLAAVTDDDFQIQRKPYGKDWKDSKCPVAFFDKSRGILEAQAIPDNTSTGANLWRFAYAGEAPANCPLIKQFGVASEPVNKDSLDSAIEGARSVSKDVKVSADGKDVDPSDSYVTPAEAAALAGAIEAAQAVLDDEAATQVQADAATEALIAARETYARAIKPGKKESDVPPSKIAIASATAADLTYAGAAKLPAPKLTVKGADGKALKAGADYVIVSVSYNKGHDAKGVAGKGYVGKAKVTIKGTGAYTGQKSVPFTVKTAADGTKAVEGVTEKTLAGIDKLTKANSSKPVAQANSATMETIAKPKSKTMTVRWKSVAGATNYLVGYKTSRAKEWAYAVTGGKDKTAYVFKAMKEGDLMEFRVAAYDGKRFARGEWTQVNCRFYREMVSLKAAAGKAKVDLKWGKVAGATGYQVLVATKADFSDAQIVNVKGGATLKTTVASFGGKPLGKGKTYYFKMRAIRQAQNVNGKLNTYIGIQSLARTCNVK